MTISAGSRYATNTVAAVTDDSGVTRQTILPAPRTAKIFNVTEHVWTDGDRPDLLSGRVYGDETLWWVIAQANPEILDWTEVAPGTVVRVPSDVA